MSINETPTLVETLNKLIKEGYTEDFVAEEKCVKALKSDKEYQPDELLIVGIYRFEGMTNPGDSSELLAIESNDGKKGTLITKYGANVSQNEDLIREINTRYE